MVLQVLAERRGQGVILVVVSAIVFSTAGIFTKGIPVDAWTVIFWRGVAAAGFTLLYLAMTRRLGSEMRQMRGPGWLVVVLSALGTAAFIPAFKLTSVANVALIYAASPFVAAALAWLALRERPSPPVVVGSLLALCGVALIVGGSLGGGSLRGDLLALWMTLMMSAVMVVYRRWPETPAALPAVLSSIVLLPPALIFADPLRVEASALPALIAFGLIFAIASVTLLEGARRLPSAEAALLSALETPFAPLLAWLILAELPATLTVLGGVIVLVAVFGAQIWQIAQKRV
ncbi:MAG: DMT family transporter [Pseudomonadota bacterium]